MNPFSMFEEMFNDGGFPGMNGMPGGFSSFNMNNMSRDLNLILHKRP